jgi:hypothetical protein
MCGEKTHSKLIDLTLSSWQTDLSNGLSTGCLTKFGWVLAYGSGHKVTNYIWLMSYGNIYPHLHFEYRTFSERFKEAETFITNFSIPELNFVHWLWFWSKTYNLIHIFEVPHLNRHLAQVLFVIIAMQTNILQDHILNNRTLTLIKDRVIRLKLSFCLYLFANILSILSSKWTLLLCNCSISQITQIAQKRFYSKICLLIWIFLRNRSDLICFSVC